MHARSALLLAVGVSVFAAAVPLRAQSLADVAKKEEERRKSVPAPAKVYTNKDLTAVPEGTPPPNSIPAPAPATPGAPAASAPAASKDAETGEVKDQAYWAGRKKALQEKLDRDTTYADAMQTKINSLTTDFVNRDDPAQRSVLERDRQKTVAELGRLKKTIEEDKKAIADLEEEARRAGVPPGWLR